MKFVFQSAMHSFSLAVSIAAALLVLLYFPIAIMQDWLLIRNRKTFRIECDHSASAEQGRRVLCVVTTSGQNPMVVEHILSVLRSYNLSIELFVIKEEKDRFTYSATEITVPGAYETGNRTKHKMRALQYGIERLHDLGYDRETYICHLDDDSLVTEEYLEHIFRMKEEAGQGFLRLRKTGVHMLSTLADMVRVSNCDSFCHFFNAGGHPKSVHGEGLVIRADVEYQLGWDYGTYGADDLIMGQLIVKQGYSFGFIPHPIFIAPPVSARDFYKQRRRWIMSILWSSRRIREIDAVTMDWFLYRYAVGWTGVLGIVVFAFGILEGFMLPLPVEAMLVFNLLSYFLFYQYGSARTSKKYMIPMALLQFPVALYEGGTLIYSLLFPPARDSFDVITKV
ncbi:MAG: glycosyltransferase family 2 protein [Candidatus Thermoplasmatota archaeon]|nr:glycosyltransferase family 2 protein [Candidatus Thermoplasmatota archaeon]